MRLREDLPTLAEIALSQGYFTACITCNPFVTSDFGLARGFEFHWQYRGSRTERLVNILRDILMNRLVPEGQVHDAAEEWFENASSFLLSTARLDNGAKQALQELRQVLHDANKPPFVFVNLMEAHDPFYGRGRFARLRSRWQFRDFLRRWPKVRSSILSGRRKITKATRSVLKQIYTEGARYLDFQLGELFKSLPRAFLDEGFLIVVSDHGELLGEKGRAGHLAGLDEHLIRVPLVIRPPCGVIGERIDLPLTTSWLFWLLRDILSGSPQPLESWLSWIEGRDFVRSEAQGSLTPGMAGLVPVPAAELLAFRILHDHPAIAGISGDWKLICHLGRTDDELYNVRIDTLERKNVASKQNCRLVALHGKLKERLVQGDTDRRTIKPRRDAMSLRTKRALADIVIRAALKDGSRTTICWSGRTGSTLLLSLTLDVVHRDEVPMPPVLFLDHGHHPPGTSSFVEEVAFNEDFEVITMRNEVLTPVVKSGVRGLSFDSLSVEMQNEALRAGLDDSTVPLSLETAVGSHLLLTTPLCEAIRRHGFDTVITGIRWEEHAIWSDETFFSSREKPKHTRVHPLLPWTKADLSEYASGLGLPVYDRVPKAYDVQNESSSGMRTIPPREIEPETANNQSDWKRGRRGLLLRSIGYF